MINKRHQGLSINENESENNPCSFMRLPKCMRQDVTKRLDLAICQACISGRIEGHLFAIKQKMVDGDTNRG